jgi:hypothetical protein
MTGLAKVGGVTSVIGIATAIAAIYNQKKMEKDFRDNVQKIESGKKKRCRYFDCCSLFFLNEKEKIAERRRKDYISYENLYNITIEMESLKQGDGHIKELMSAKKNHHDIGLYDMVECGPFEQ